MAAKKKTFTAELSQQMADSYYDGMRQAKVHAGLSLADAIEVTARQRAEDEANNVTPFLDLAEADPETPPEA